MQWPEQECLLQGKVWKDLKINAVIWDVLLSGVGREEGTVGKHKQNDIISTDKGTRSCRVKKVTVWGVPNATELPLFLDWLSKEANGMYPQQSCRVCLRPSQKQRPYLCKEGVFWLR